MNHGCWSDVWLGTKSKMTREGPARAQPPEVCQSREADQKLGGCSCNPKRHTRSPPLERDRWARSKLRRPQAISNSRVGQQFPSDRRRHRHRYPERIGDRSDRQFPFATTRLPPSRTAAVLRSRNPSIRRLPSGLLGRRWLKAHEGTWYYARASPILGRLTFRMSRAPRRPKRTKRYARRLHSVVRPPIYDLVGRKGPCS